MVAKINSILQLNALNFDSIPVDDSWNVANAKELKMHKIHLYPAKFPAFITTKALEYADKNNINIETIADIFCGCGTTAFEAKRNGKNFWGCDINPVATLIAKTKSRKYEDSKIAYYLECIMLAAKNDTVTDEEIEAVNERIRYWYFDGEVVDLLKLKKAIYAKTEDGDIYRDFFLTAFSNILKSTSRWLAKSIKPQIDPNKKPVNPFTAFEAQIKFMREANNESDIPVSKKKVKIENTSILGRKISKEFVDLIVTSPPYVTSYEYADLHQLSTLWLDFVDDFRSLREGAIGSLYHQVDFESDMRFLNATAKSTVDDLLNGEKRKAKLVAKYFVDMQKSIDKCHKMLNPAGFALFVIGNTEYKGVRINNAKHLAESMLASGFRDIEIRKRNISSKFLTPYRDQNGKFTTNKGCRKIYAEEFIVVGKK